MKTSKSLVALIGAVLFCLFAVSGSAVDKEWRTSLRVSEPTEIPGKVLPPGDYVVKVLDSWEARSVVQFLNADESQVVATVLGVPDYRVRTPESAQFVYFQRGEGSPQALRSWFYPGYNYGIEFVYPKEKAILLAEKSKEPVLATRVPAEPGPKSEVVVLTPEKKEVKLEEYRSTTVKTIEPPKAKVPAEPPKTEVAESAPARLPKTGSNLPLIGLLGLAALGGAAVVRMLGRR